jgi:thiol-disulfide isomerase/thioredoxin
LIGRKQNGDCLIVADTDNDNNFSNETVYTFAGWFNKNERIPADSLPYVSITNLVSNYGGKKAIFSADVQLRPFKRDSTFLAKGRVLSELGLSLISSGSRMGKFRIKGKKYKIAVRSLIPKYVYDTNNTIVAISRKAEPFAFQVKQDISSLYHPGDIVNLRNAAIELSGVSANGREINLKVVQRKNEQEFITGIAFEEFVTRDTLSFRALLQGNEYMIADFWGSWCQPCISSFPDLKELNRQLAGKGVGLVGFIYDDTANTGKISSLINRFDITWPQLFIPRDRENTIVEKNRVLSFPTYFLINSKGRIVYRDSGKEGLERLKQKLKELII